MGQILFTTFAGAIAGLLAWLVTEPSAPKMFMDPAGEQWAQMFALLLGGAIAGTLGGIYGWQRGSRRHFFLGLTLGVILGALFGRLGLGIGSGLAYSMFPGFDMGFSAKTIPGRLLQTIPVGALLGLAVGISTRSWKQMLLGLIGGTLGGATAGFTFDAISSATAPMVQAARGGNEIGVVGRAALSIILGGAIGLFVSLARQVAKTAWLRLSLGRNEGKEWVVDAAQTFIGRSEAAHVPLFGDPTIAPMHACITRQGPHYWLQDGGAPGGTRLNGQPVQQAPLTHGAQIGVGGYVLEFLMRAGSAPARAAERLGGQAYPAAPQPSGSGLPLSSPPGADSRPCLVALSGPIAGQRFSLTGPLEIGREGTGVALSFDATASRRHARVEPVGSGWQVLDLGSTNGTLVNGVRTAQASLNVGDVVQIGATVFRFE